MDIVLFSGGKDSLALVLFLRQKGEDFRLVYNSYGYEPVFYWDYLWDVSKKLGLELDITYPVKDFLEIFKTAPTGNVPHCRQYIKISPFCLYLRDRKVNKVFVGIRSDEKRKCPKGRECPFINKGITLQGVNEIIRKSDIPLHPLYGLGFSRVSCIPCPNWGLRDVSVCLRYGWCKKLLFQVLDVVFSYHPEVWIKQKARWYWRVRKFVSQRTFF
jgi:3'-phosphoadenosine 5'-phosphosulfate sulfotransferase (PAPS reductase)/FAD synthetase